jgi:plasmid stability protein
MATLVIRNVEPIIHTRLKALATAHGHSMEEEARLILRDRLAAVPDTLSVNWVDAIRALFEPLGSLELREIPRQPPRTPPDSFVFEWDPSA